MLRACLVGRVGETVGMTGLGVDCRCGKEGLGMAWVAAGLAVVPTMSGDLEGKIWGEGKLSSCPKCLWDLKLEGGVWVGPWALGSPSVWGTSLCSWSLVAVHLSSHFLWLILGGWSALGGGVGWGLFPEVLAKFSLAPCAGQTDVCRGGGQADKQKAGSFRRRQPEERLFAVFTTC